MASPWSGANARPERKREAEALLSDPFVDGVMAHVSPALRAYRATVEAATIKYIDEVTEAGGVSNVSMLPLVTEVRSVLSLVISTAAASDEHLESICDRVLPEVRPHARRLRENLLTRAGR